MKTNNQEPEFDKDGLWGELIQHLLTKQRSEHMLDLINFRVRGITPKETSTDIMLRMIKKMILQKLITSTEECIQNKKDGVIDETD